MGSVGYYGKLWGKSELADAHKSLLPWAQSTATGYIMEFCPLDGMGIFLLNSVGK